MKIYTIIPLVLAISFPVIEVSADSLVLEEVVVTARKREQNLQDVGISVTAFSGDQITALGYSNIVDISAQVPGVDFLSPHQTNAAISIRGVSQNDFADHLEPPVALYVDEAYVPYPGAAVSQIFDVERVEILRGPQGTLFGRNATGGLVHILSRQPGDILEGFVQVDAGEYNLLNVEGAIGGPITDQVRGRFSFVSNNQDGWFKNRIEKDLGNANNYATRLQFVFDTSDRTQVSLKLYASRNKDELGTAYDFTPAVLNSEGLGREVGADEIATWPNIVLGGGITAPCAGCDINGYSEPDNNPYTGSLEHRGGFDREHSGATVKITADFSAFQFTSISDYQMLDKDFSGDIDASPFPFFVFNTGQESSHFAQELRLDGSNDRLSWIGGLYYLDIDSEYNSSVNFDLSPYIGIPAGSVIGQGAGEWDQDVRSLAVFGSLEYSFTSTLSGIFGARYTNDKKDHDYILDDTTLGGGVFRFNPQTHPNKASPTFDNVSIRAQLDWKVTPDALLYFSYNRGHKAGNFAAPVFGVPVDPVFRETILPNILPHDEEVLSAFEIGAKTEWLDGRARFNTSIYYYDYKDYQVFSLQNAAQAIFNRDATVSGGEAELIINPVEGLDIILGTSLMWTKEVQDVPTLIGPRDREMPMSPDWTANALVRYQWPALGGNFALQADLKWTDDFYFYALNAPISLEDGYNVVNARASYTTGDEHWEFAAWIKNLTETEYNVFRLDLGLLGGCSCAPAPPRWYGVTARYSWF